MAAAATARPMRRFHIHWGPKDKGGTYGYYAFDAPTEREARAMATAELKARFTGTDGWRLAWADDVTDQPRTA